MKPEWLSVWRQTRAAVVLALVAMVLGVGLVLFFDWQSDSLRSKVAQAQSAFVVAQENLQAKRVDVQYLKTNIGRFHQLEQLGMLGVPDRASWIEELTASHQRLELPDSLDYTLQSPQPVSAQAAAATQGAEGNPVADANAMLYHDLDFTLSRVHEVELLNLLDDYARHVRGRYRINTCELTDRTPEGLKAHCQLRFFNLPNSGAIRK